LNKTDSYHFNALKKAISTVFLEAHSASESLKNWKGEDISLFQEDLFHKVKAKVSEKWFYTYMKNDAEKLPRIDVLNLLSEYVGFKNWNAFKASQKTILKSIDNKKSFKKGLIIVPILILLSVLIYHNFKANEFHFCFIDADKNESVTTALDIIIFQDAESPIYLKTDSLGCFSYPTKQDKIRFVVQSPYYKTDTVTRFINSNTNNRINLQTDDYMLMLHYYSNSNLKDWQKRKQQLQNLFANDAVIYQLFSNKIDIELYTKSEFIRKLTTPTSSLKNIKILYKTFSKGQITKLKFMIQ
jgi:hypothetical protein